MLTVVLIGTLDSGKGDSSHFVFLSFVSGCSLSQPCDYIIAHSGAFVKGFFEKSCTKYQKFFAFVLCNMHKGHRLFMVC
jgi:hypothetical protein